MLLYFQLFRFPPRMIGNGTENVYFQFSRMSNKKRSSWRAIITTRERTECAAGKFISTTFQILISSNFWTMFRRSLGPNVWCELRVCYVRNIASRWLIDARSNFSTTNIKILKNYEFASRMVRYKIRISSLLDRICHQCVNSSKLYDKHISFICFRLSYVNKAVF